MHKLGSVSCRAKIEFDLFNNVRHLHVNNSVIGFRFDIFTRSGEQTMVLCRLYDCRTATSTLQQWWNWALSFFLYICNCLFAVFVCVYSVHICLVLHVCFSDSLSVSVALFFLHMTVSLYLHFGAYNFIINKKTTILIIQITLRPNEKRFPRFPGKLETKMGRFSAVFSVYRPTASSKFRHKMLVKLPAFPVRCDAATPRSSKI